MTTRAPARPVSASWPVYERSVLSGVLGLPGYAAIGIALGFTALGVFIDLTRISGLGTIFKGCYFVGCVLAVCWVKRRALFGPVVQPPLLLAVAVPAVVLASDNGNSDAGPDNAGLTDHLLSIGTPLLNGFPTMAVTTAFAVAIGICRYVLQRPGPEDAPAAVPPPRPASAAVNGPSRRSRTERGTAGQPGAREPGEGGRGERGRGARRSAERASADERASGGRGPGGPTRSERGRGERRSSDRPTADRQPGDRPPADRAQRDRRGSDRAPRERPGSDRSGARELPGRDRRSDPSASAGTDRRPPAERRATRPPGDRPPASKRRDS